MAGIYIHIPFCKQACFYCDFHFSTNLKPQSDMVACICRELEMRKDYLKNTSVSTIYFGGGTPSLLTEKEINDIMACVRKNFVLEDSLEITLEANPDDLTFEKLAALKNCGINRLSIGIQTFDEDSLKSMNRSHNADQARNCLKVAIAAGFDQISADLIFALPPEESATKRFENDLRELIEFDISHVSLYGLTIEHGTVFGHRFAKNEFPIVTEESNAIQYESAIAHLTMAGFEHYEVSNFAKNGHYSRHNSSYWKDVHYLGVGPGAHSFNGSSRSYNISNNQKYLKSISVNHLPIETENLSQNQQLNEYILIRTRTKWGLNLSVLNKNWSYDLMTRHGDFVTELLNRQLAELNQDNLRLTSKGFSLADEIALRFFIEE